MSRDTSIIRQAEIRKLPLLCRALVEILERRGLGPESALAAWRAEVAAICPQCGIPVSGAELFALAHPPAAETATAKIGRLRLGDCARSGCDSYHYQLTFKMHGDFDWMDILSQAEGILHDQEHPAGSNATQRHGVSHLARLLWRSRRARRFCIALAAVLLLMLARQWYVGGRIPLLREPEHFRLTPGQRRPTPPRPRMSATFGASGSARDSGDGGTLVGSQV